MERSLSDSDMRAYIPNVLLYSQLEDKTPEQLLDHLPLAILYQETERQGHWTLLHHTSEGIEFFDPYGIEIDKEFKELKWKQPHYLAKLLYKLSDTIQINYNEFKFQKRDPNINTCGRWCILRALLPNMPIKKFGELVVKACNKLNVSPDQVVTLAFTK